MCSREDDPTQHDRKGEEVARERRPLRRGDNIPDVSAYKHYNEEAYAMWYAENRYDMKHADELLEEDLIDREYDGDEGEFEDE
jgi:hypothetical protein